MSNIEDRAIEATDRDAVEAKRWAVRLGYWEDEYVRGSTVSMATESVVKAVEISRGYFARTKAVEAVVKAFITNNEGAQIINIGAGSDTLYFRLMDQGLSPNKYVELDLAENVVKKINQMAQVKLFRDRLGMINFSKTDSSISQDPYYLFVSDLRSNPQELINFLKDNANIDLNKPTIFIAECVFVYILTEIVDSFLEVVVNNFKNASFLSYDPVNMNDAFGKVMIRNLKMRHIELRGVSAYENKETILKRYKNANFRDVKIWSISEVYKSFSPKALKRIESIEMLDDPDMMTQLFDHYCLILSSTRPGLFKNDDLKVLLANVL